jgi:uncharacterized repeat protein (TIGR01451 family)
MHRWMERLLVIALTGAVVLIPARAFAEGDVTVTLTANRMTTNSAGAEVAASAAQARPGDVIEYRASYRNVSASRVHGVAATLPIPPGTEYLAHSASPAAQLASLDGRTFAPMPLTRKVRLADGREVTRDVPFAEYRALRWTFASLDANKQQLVRARVRVTKTEIADNTQH